MSHVQLMDDLHISLSRTLYLKVFQIEPFVQRMAEALVDVKRYGLRESSMAKLKCPF